MSEAQQLFQLQSLDLEIEEITKKIQVLDDKLCESEELTAARQNEADLQARLKSEQKTAQELDWDLSDVTSKLRTVEKKLYDGSVKNPKELASIQQEADILKEKKGEIETQALELMDTTEETKAAINTAKTTLAEVCTHWQAEQGDVLQERSQLETRLATLTESREALAKTFKPATMAVYDDLRQTRRGKAVAKVEQNACQGCRISLPSSEVQKARTSPDLVFCSSCGRILLATR
jgi:predicted  nucleic acid-binding Zn-ribbon protein